MSKTERRKLFQPVPLSSILDPTFKAPFSKLENSQVDMDISLKSPQQTVWQKLQSGLLSAMSNFVIMTNPIFTSSANTVYRSTQMSLVPWRSFQPCELLINQTQEIEDYMTVSQLLPATSAEPGPANSTSLIQSIRSGLQCLQYFATHPVRSEENENEIGVTQTPTRYYHDSRKQNNNIVLPAVGYPIVGGGCALFFPFISSTDSSSDSTSRYSLSAPVSPTHSYQHQSSRPVVSNLFSWAMHGFLLGLQNSQFNSLNKNYCIFSPMHTKGSAMSTTPLSPQNSSENISPSCNTQGEGNIRFFAPSSPSSSSSPVASHDSTASGDPSVNSASSASPTKVRSVTNSPSRPNTSISGSNSGCVRIETNWMTMNDNSNSSRTNFHAMSVCSSSSTLMGGTLTFSCSSSMSSSPRAMASSTRAIPRRFRTESESSDSLIEFSASVESTDSLCIVFESAAGAEDDGRVQDDEEWEDEDDEDDDSDEDDDDDQIFNYSSSNSDDIFVDGYIFPADGIEFCNPCDQVDFCGDRGIPTKSRKAKTVSFDEEHLENIVEFEDDLESKSSREPYWEMLGRDRCRFQDRILRTGAILESILKPSHRLEIYRQRFSQVDETHFE